MRREGLYSSIISEWCTARDAGQLGAFQRRQGRPPQISAPRFRNGCTQ